MYNYISRVIVNKFVEINVIKKDEIEVYEYGFSLLISLTLSLLTILVIGTALGILIPTLLYLAGFFLIRIYAGGYHTNSFHRCFMLTNSTYLFFAVLYICYKNDYIFYFINNIWLVCSIIILLLFSPVNDLNNPMSDYRRYHNKMICNFIAIILILFLAFQIVFKIKLIHFIAGVNIASFFIPLALLKNRKEESYEKNIS